MSCTAPTTLQLDEGTYDVTFPVDVILNNKNYQFSSWEDGGTNPVRTIVLNQDKTVNANYVEVNLMANVTFSGTISPVSAGIRPVTVKVTLPDSTIDTLPIVNTDISGNFTTSKQYTSGIVIKGQASVPADSQNKAGISSVITFTVPLADTTVTLVIS